MKSSVQNITRLPSAGQYFVQAEDPRSSARNGDIWVNTETGGVNVYEDGKWSAIKLSGVALMDACITNHLLAADINAGKITAGRLESQNGEFMLDLDTGEASLQNMNLGGKVQGNVIAESNDGKMRIRLVGKDPTKNVSAQIIFEARDNVGDEWTQKGDMWLGYGNHATMLCMQNIEVGTGYNRSRPTLAHNHSARDGILVKPYSQDLLRAAYVTYHGFRLVKRDVAFDTTHNKQFPFENIPAINAARGNALTGSSVKARGVYTMTYALNEVARIDFDMIITTAGTSDSPWGISRALLRQLNENIPVIEPTNGGWARILTSSGTPAASDPIMLIANSNMGVWEFNLINSDLNETRIYESAITMGMRITGVCYGKYSFSLEV